MLSSLAMLFLCLHQTVWGQQQTDYRFMTSRTHKESTGADSRPNQGRARAGRAIQGGAVTNATLVDRLSDVVEDPVKYYTWRTFGPHDQRTRELWVDMSDIRRADVRVHGILSNSYKQAVVVALSFDFPYYGHYLKQITIATGGFVFTGDITHRLLTATQYIAPLMADFDPSHSKDSIVQYLDDGEMFVVQWEQVRLSRMQSKGGFTFQVALHKTGNITFGYREIPLPLDMISSDDHPVKVGLSDAFMLKQTIHEYHRFEINTTEITSFSAVEFTALPTCLQLNSCELCLSSSQTSDCRWCNILQRCSDGMDRHRQEWLDNACSLESENATCGVSSTVQSTTGSTEIQEVTSLTPRQRSCDSVTKLQILQTDVTTDPSTKSDLWMSTGVIVGIAAALVLLLTLIVVALYINYHHPNTASPLYAIQRRRDHWPSWKFQKQHPSYTEVEGEGAEKDCIVEAGAH
ncbi:plexin domain-containing protein 1-like isoform X1 [Nelusetta ayraudi]|uniref:plexin domain-containing protein 1-like isoform X1 n=1 Tax=Nelusetta ayraudi TaxID=303726 RepID=UPI003F700214